jgi:5-methylcytosine-specific restriction endonuclease McrA
MSILNTIRPCKKCGALFSGIRCKACKKLIPVNKEKAKARQDAWQRANPGVSVARASAWNAAHPERRRELVQNRRAKLREIGGKLSKGLAERLFKLQRGKCACCGEPLGADYHLDHVMPLALGGSNTDDNMQLLRQPCNSRKNARHPVDYMQSKGLLL